MDVNFSRRGVWTIVSVEGRIDTISAPDFEKKIKQRIREGVRRFVVDFSKLEYITSAGLHSILVAERRSKAKGGEVACCAMKSIGKEVFRISGLPKLIPVFDTVEIACDRQ